MMMMTMMMVLRQLEVVDKLLGALANTEYVFSQREAAVTLSCICHIADESLHVNQTLAGIVGSHLHQLILVSRQLCLLPVTLCTYIIQGGAKNGASLSRCKYYENSMTELRGNWWTSAIGLLYAEHSH